MRRIDGDPRRTAVAVAKATTPNQFLGEVWVNERG
jgi:hypothetical protein